MEVPYQCPTCGTNRTRFNLIKQVVLPVKKDPLTGEVMEHLDDTDPFQVPYRGEAYRIQCGVCGQVETEERFIKTAQRGSEPTS